MKKQLILHIGYPKTSTTWLQLNVFPNLEDLNFIAYSYINEKRYKIYDTVDYSPKGFGNKLKQLREKLKFIKAPAHYGFIPKISFYGDDIYQEDEIKYKFDKLTTHSKYNLVSCEGLLRPFSVQKTTDRLSVLKENFDIKIIITIRRQKEIIQSRYFHDINLKWTDFYPLKKALEEDENSYQCRFPACRQRMHPCGCQKNYGCKLINMPYYNFNKTFKIYQDTFGKENIHVAVYEQFVQDKLTYFKKMLNFIGIERSDNNILEFANIKPLNTRSTKFKKEVKEKNGVQEFEQQLERIQNYFAPSNELLNKEIETNLQTYGYF